MPITRKRAQGDSPSPDDRNPQKRHKVETPKPVGKERAERETRFLREAKEPTPEKERPKEPTPEDEVDWGTGTESEQDDRPGPSSRAGDNKGKSKTDFNPDTAGDRETDLNKNSAFKARYEKYVKNVEEAINRLKGIKLEERETEYQINLLYIERSDLPDPRKSIEIQRLRQIHEATDVSEQVPVEEHHDTVKNIAYDYAVAERAMNNDARAEGPKLETPQQRVDRHLKLLPNEIEDLTQRFHERPTNKERRTIRDHQEKEAIQRLGLTKRERIAELIRISTRASALDTLKDEQDSAASSDRLVDLAKKRVEERIERERRAELLPDERDKLGQYAALSNEERKAHNYNAIQSIKSSELPREEKEKKLALIHSRKTRLENVEKKERRKLTEIELVYV